MNRTFMRLAGCVAGAAGSADAVTTSAERNDKRTRMLIPSWLGRLARVFPAIEFSAKHAKHAKHAKKRGRLSIFLCVLGVLGVLCDFFNEQLGRDAQATFKTNAGRPTYFCAAFHPAFN